MHVKTPQGLAHSMCSINVLLLPVSPTLEGRSEKPPDETFGPPSPCLPRPGDSADTHLHRHRGVPDCSMDHDPQHPASRVRVCVLVSAGCGAEGQCGRVADAGASGAVRSGLCDLE